MELGANDLNPWEGLEMGQITNTIYGYHLDKKEVGTTLTIKVLRGDFDTFINNIITIHILSKHKIVNTKNLVGKLCIVKKSEEIVYSFHDLT